MHRYRADEFDGKLPYVIVSNSNALSDGSYAKLSLAFAAINANLQTSKNIVVTLIGNTTEISTATLNQGAWTTLKIYPTKTGLSISGNIAGSPIIDFNGADNVTLDGRVNQTGSTRSLSITNSSSSTTAGTSTVNFSNSAELNTLKYVSVYGSSASTTDGVIKFATSTSGNGNDNNLIDNCAVTNSSGNRPVNAIYSLGSAASDNSSNTISNNIYDFINSSTSSNGIYLGANSTAWTISTNSFTRQPVLCP
jgi:hypothetical protein